MKIYFIFAILAVLAISVSCKDSEEKGPAGLPHPPKPPFLDHPPKLPPPLEALKKLHEEGGPKGGPPGLLGILKSKIEGKKD